MTRSPLAQWQRRLNVGQAAAVAFGIPAVVGACALCFALAPALAAWLASATLAGLSVTWAARLPYSP